MAYRKIIVDGTEYQYTIGRSYTKVRGHAVWHNSDVGDLLDTGREQYVVQPSHVAEMIMNGKRDRRVKMCEQHNKPKRFTSNPYVVEIEQKNIYGWWCDDCHADIAADI